MTASIVVLGEALVDVFPDAEVIGGAPFNVARHLQLLGAAPVTITRIGIDAAGARIAREFSALGMDKRGLQHDPHRPTGTVAVELHDRGHRFHIADDVAWDAIDAGDALACVRAVPAIACFGTLAQRAPTSRAAIRAALAGTDAVRVLDLNLRGSDGERALAEESLAWADVVKVADDELVPLLDWLGIPDAASLPWGEPRLVAGVRALMQRHRLARLVVTRGARGWACFEGARAEVLEGATAPVEVVDTVGAGDAFTAVMLLGMANRWPVPLTLARAGDYAASVCMHRGSFDLGASRAGGFVEAWRQSGAR